MTRAEYVKKYWYLALSIGERWGLSPVAIIAHALKESFTNPNAPIRHNYFGFLKSSSPRKFWVYPSDEAGYTHYAKRLTEAFPAVVEAGHVGAEAFAKAVAFHSSPTYVHESLPKKQEYARTLASIYKSVAADAKRLGLPLTPPVPIAGVVVSLLLLVAVSGF